MLYSHQCSNVEKSLCRCSMCQALMRKNGTFLSLRCFYEKHTGMLHKTERSIACTMVAQSGLLLSLQVSRICENVKKYQSLELIKY